MIFATVPSSDYYKPLPDAIHIGLNFAWKKENIPLNYLFTTDNPAMSEMEKGFEKILDDIFVSKLVGRLPWSWLNYPEDVSLRWRKVHRFYMEDASDCPIYQDICYHPVVTNSTVAFMAMHFALFTYPKEIYIVGCDLGTVYDHFYDQDQKGRPATPFPAGDRVKVTWARMKIHAARYYPETKIISINPIGLKGLFEDVYTDEYKASLQK